MAGRRHLKKRIETAITTAGWVTVWRVGGISKRELKQDVPLPAVRSGADLHLKKRIETTYTQLRQDSLNLGRHLKKRIETLLAISNTMSLNDMASQKEN